MKTSKEIKLIPLEMIQPDVNQPRKNFNAERISELMSSIKKHGIMNPLIIERRHGDKYVLVDGERRFIASTRLGLKEVPAVIVEPQNDVDRLVQQFHIQEQHEGWSALEKAVAVSQLADQLKIGVKDISDILSIDAKTIGRYVNFSLLLEKKEFQKNEIPLEFATTINTLKRFVKKAYLKIEEEFTQDMERVLERAIIYRIKDATISRPMEILKLLDAVRVNPKIIERFMKNNDVTVDKVFLESKAKVSYLYRNVFNGANNITSHIREGMKLGMHKMYGEGFETELRALKVLRDTVDELIRKAE